LYSTCMRDCYDTCFIESEVKDGRLVVKGSSLNPITSGFLCPKGQMFSKWVHSTERLEKPMIRMNGKLVETDLERAIEIVAEKIKEFIRKGDEEKILVYQYAGDRGVVNYHFPMRLFHKIGVSFLDHGICDRAGQEALKAIYKTAIGLDPEELSGKNLIVYWGMNPFWTNLHGFMLAKRFGLEIWTVDVYKTQTVKRSDRYFLIKPGSDVEFAAAILKVMLENGWYDKRVESLKGFTGLKEMLHGLDMKLSLIHI
jgi:anaerobic selenocysteine-containing dehydrogenase